MSKLFAMAFPLPKSNEQEWHVFMNECRTTRKEDFNKSRKNLGVRERTFLQQTPAGPLVLVTLEGDDPEQAFKKFGEGSDEFSKWFMGNVQRLHGVDLAKPPEGPLPELVIDTEG